MRAKLMRKRKKFGRCCVAGHSDCHVTQEIQHPLDRHADKEDFLEELDVAHKEMLDTKMDEPV